MLTVRAISLDLTPRPKLEKSPDLCSTTQDVILYPMTAGTALIIAALIVVGNCTDLTLTGDGSGDTISTFRPAVDGPLEKHNCGTRSVSTVAHVMAISE